MAAFVKTSAYGVNAPVSYFNSLLRRKSGKSSSQTTSGRWHRGRTRYKPPCHEYPASRSGLEHWKPLYQEGKPSTPAA